jgi:hypothetical protein
MILPSHQLSSWCGKVLLDDPLAVILHNIYHFQRVWLEVVGVYTVGVTFRGNGKFSKALWSSATSNLGCDMAQAYIATGTEINITNDIDN